jgi:hypothetical protein
MRSAKLFAAGLAAAKTDGRAFRRSKEGFSLGRCWRPYVQKAYHFAKQKIESIENRCGMVADFLQITQRVHHRWLSISIIE